MMQTTTSSTEGPLRSCPQTTLPKFRSKKEKKKKLKREKKKKKEGLCVRVHRRRCRNSGLKRKKRKNLKRKKEKKKKRGPLRSCPQTMLPIQVSFAD